MGEPAAPSSSNSTEDGPSTPSVSYSGVREDGGNDDQRQEDQQLQQSRPSSSAAAHRTPHHRLGIPMSDLTFSEIRDDFWSCLVVLLTFWFFVFMMLMLGFYGSVNLQLGPNCSRLIKTNPLFVQYIKAKWIGEQEPGPVLYGFYKPPRPEVEVTWTETHMSFIPIDFHKEWVYFLNKGSRIEVLYSVKSPHSSPLSLVIARGRESLVEWIQDPSSPNATLSWTIIHGIGEIQQEISESSNYYIAVANLNFEEVEVELKFTIKAFIYNTTEAYYKCSLSNQICNLNMFLWGNSAAILTSLKFKEGASYDWYVKLSYGPRWITYFVGSGMITLVMLLALRYSSGFHGSSGGRYEAGEIAPERAPLLAHKDDEDVSSWGSSYDSFSHDEENLEEGLAVSNFLEGKPGAGEGENPRRLCVICFDAPRDCFFLPCGHCAACFTCGTRIAEEAGICPICRTNMKKVRKIFTV